MDYEKIHDSIIERARNRIYDSIIHHKHHIIPIHEDQTSTETVPLTYKEHRLVHLLRWKFVGTIGNKLAYNILSNKIDEETRLMVCSLAGKTGGKTTKENKAGIFSDSWDRSEETKRRWQDGTINKTQFNDYAHCSLAGKTTYELRRGIHSEDYDRTAANKEAWKNQTLEQLSRRIEMNKTNSKKGAEVSKQLGKNFSSWDVDKRKSASSKGGKKTGKLPLWTNGFINKKGYECPGEGFFRGVTKKKRNSNEIVTYIIEENK